MKKRVTLFSLYIYISYNKLSNCERVRAFFYHCNCLYKLSLEGIVLYKLQIVFIPSRDWEIKTFIVLPLRHSLKKRTFSTKKNSYSTSIYRLLVSISFRLSLHSIKREWNNHFSKKYWHQRNSVTSSSVSEKWERERDNLSSYQFSCYNNNSDRKNKRHIST